MTSCQKSDSINESRSPQQEEQQQDEYRYKITSWCKKPKAPSFQIGAGWNLAGLFLSKYASTDGVGFPIWRHTFKMIVMAGDRRTSASTRRCRSLLHMQFIKWPFLWAVSDP